MRGTLPTIVVLLGGLCVAPAAVAQNVARGATVEFGGLSRTYRVFTPGSLASGARVPLVVVLHGGFGTGVEAERAYHWDDLATRFGFVVLYPDGFERAWNAGTCCGAPQRRNIDDVGFLSALIGRVVRERNLDPNRIYVTGMSNGAMMAYRMACDAPLAIAAIGPVSGTLTVPCKQPKPTSVLAVHGLSDENVPFGGGVGKGFTHDERPSVPASIARWREIDGCSAPVDRTLGRVTESLAQCIQGRAVELITIAGAGHQWPGAVPPPALARALLQLDQPSTAMNATTRLWQFFSAHHS